MKVSIVGMGHVGTATAHALVSQGLASNLVLTSRDTRKAEGHALDLQHASAMLPHVAGVRGGDLQLTEGSDLVILAHSVPTERAGRKLLAPGNAELFRATAPPLVERSPDAVFLVLSNPVDALTWLFTEVTSLDPLRVIGAGAIIDSVRLRTLLSSRFRIHPDDLRVYVLGEHGERQFPAVSLSTGGGVRFKDEATVRELFVAARDSAFEVFHAKGYTNYAIAQAAVMITRCVTHNEHRTLPVSTRIDGFLGIDGVCLSLPCVVGSRGVERVLHPDFPEDEAEAFRAAAASVRETLALMA